MKSNLRILAAVLLGCICSPILWAQVEYYRTIQGIDYFLGARIFSSTGNITNFEREAGPAGEKFFLSEPLILKEETQELSLVFKASHQTGDLLFIPPGSNNAVLLFNTAKAPTGNEIKVLGTFKKGDEPIFLFRTRDTKTGKLIERYTGENRKGIDKFVSNTASPFGGYRWAIMSWIAPDLVQYNFADESGKGFEALSFRIRIRRKPSITVNNIVVKSMGSEAKFHGSLYLASPYESKTVLLKNHDFKSVTLNPIELSEELVFRYEVKEQPKDIRYSGPGDYTQSFVSNIKGKFGPRYWIAGRSSDGIIHAAFEDYNDFNFVDMMIEISGNVSLYTGLPISTSSAKEDSLVLSAWLSALPDSVSQPLRKNVKYQKGRIVSLGLAGQDTLSLPAFLSSLSALDEITGLQGSFCYPPKRLAWTLSLKRVFLKPQLCPDLVVGKDNSPSTLGIQRSSLGRPVLIVGNGAFSLRVDGRFGLVLH